MWMITKTWSLWLGTILFGFLSVISFLMWVSSVASQQLGTPGSSILSFLVLFLAFKISLSHLLFLKQERRRVVSEILSEHSND
jgi:hypothetical protein